MNRAPRDRFRLLLAELKAIQLWDRTYLTSLHAPDRYDVLSYRARQERLMQIADELACLELTLREGTAQRSEGFNAEELDAPSTTQATTVFPDGVLATWPTLGRLPN
jgi:hypothetical protein